MGNLMIYVEMVRPSDVKNILRLVFPLVFKVALLFTEVRCFSSFPQDSWHSFTSFIR